MSEIVVVGSFKAKPGKEEEAVEAMLALVQPTHDEEGCVLYAFNRGADDPADMAFVERWSSKETHDGPRASSARERSPPTRHPEPAAGSGPG